MSRGIKRMMAVTVVFLIAVIVIALHPGKKASQDEWHRSDGSEIVCRVSGCGKKPMFSNWEDRFCSDHISNSKNYSNLYNPSTITKRINTTPALTQEQADALRGTGYHGTRPNSSAEDIEISAAMVKCKKCGMHSDNGRNSLCDECQFNEAHGFD